MATAVIMPRQGQSVESCILVEWMVKEGDSVAKGAPMASIETDKAVFEVEATEDGTVLALFFKAGDDIPVLTNIAAIGKPGENIDALRPAGGSAPAATATATAPAPETAPAAAPAASAPAAPATVSAVGVSPRARQRAGQIGVQTEGLAGTGPDGRVIERDVVAAAAQGRLTPVAMAAGLAATPGAGAGPGGMVRAEDLRAAPKAAPAATAPAVLEADKTLPVSGIRKIIAGRMRDSLATTAQLTLYRSFDATSILAFRQRVKAAGEALGLPSITLNDIVLYATARTLKKHPAANAHFLGDRIVQYARVNLGIAMDTPRGLMVPVLAGADTMSLAQISRAVKPLAQAAQAGNVNPDLLRGGTFTVTNLGALGIESFTPVLNAPEVAILGVGGLVWKPAMKNGKIEHVQAMELSLTIDHQALDGAPGARFLQDLALLLENFELSLAE